MQKLIEIQKKLKAPKNQFNAFGKYKYRSCEDILEAVKPLCTEAGLLLTISDDVVAIGDRIYIKATATITDNDTSFSVSAYAREALTKKGMDESQITGAASSYARKYALNGLFLIDDTKDTDIQKPETQETITKDQIKKIMELLEKTDSDIGKFLVYMQVNSIEEIKTSNYNKAILALQNKAKKI